MAAMLSIYVDGKHRDWDKYLLFMVFAYNVSVNKTTKFSPFFLMYGREPRFPFELASGGTNIITMGGYTTMAEDYEHRFRTAFELARQNTQSSQHKMEVQALQTHTPVDYRVRDKVWLYVKPRTDRDHAVAAKLKYPWQGPYKVVKQVSPNVVKLQELGENRLGQAVHVTRLKPYVERKPEVEPVLHEGDTFDPKLEENAMLNETLAEGEGKPEEEEEVAEIIAYRVKKGGELEFRVRWVDGDVTWKPEVNMGDMVVLDRFYYSRRNKLFFGLEINLKRFQLLFKRKGCAYSVAKQQLREAFREFIAKGRFLSGIEEEVDRLYGVGEVRQFVDNYLTTFKDKMKLAKPTRNNTTNTTDNNKNNKTTNTTIAHKRKRHSHNNDTDNDDMNIAEAIDHELMVVDVEHVGMEDDEGYEEREMGAQPSDIQQEMLEGERAVMTVEQMLKEEEGNPFLDDINLFGAEGYQREESDVANRHLCSMLMSKKVTCECGRETDRNEEMKEDGTGCNDCAHCCEEKRQLSLVELTGEAVRQDQGSEKTKMIALMVAWYGRGATLQGFCEKRRIDMGEIGERTGRER